ncbi:hypothetical protein RB195_009235 [Necator americanus]|uniref:Uncharacterized protein n=1 Tax=Necator americanus TaxID=51031 RepID=A0ABR1CSH7_NECAM
MITIKYKILVGYEQTHTERSQKTPVNELKNRLFHDITLVKSSEEKLKSLKFPIRCEKRNMMNLAIATTTEKVEKSCDGILIAAMRINNDPYTTTFAEANVKIYFSPHQSSRSCPSPVLLKVYALPSGLQMASDEFFTIDEFVEFLVASQHYAVVMVRVLHRISAGGNMLVLLRRQLPVSVPSSNTSMETWQKTFGNLFELGEGVRQERTWKGIATLLVLMFVCSLIGLASHLFTPGGDSLTQDDNGKFQGITLLPNRICTQLRWKGKKLPAFLSKDKEEENSMLLISYTDRKSYPSVIQQKCSKTNEKQLPTFILFVWDKETRELKQMDDETEQNVYPNEDHAIGSSRFSLQEKIASFLEQCATSV